MRKYKTTTNDNSRQHSLLSKLNEYKELISIIVFFLGGFFWIYGYFATKNQVKEMKSGTDYQVKKLDCVLQQNVKMLRGKMEFQYFTDLLEENKIEIRALRSDIRRLRQQGISVQDLENKVIDLEEQRADLKSERGKFKKHMEEALDQLTASTCHKKT